MAKKASSGTKPQSDTLPWQRIGQQTATAPSSGNSIDFFIPERKFKADPKYYGGLGAQRGFNYQVAYICWRLTELLDRNSQLEAIRVEGLQDVDLKFLSTDPGREPIEEYIQVKNVKGQWTLGKLSPILQRFQGILEMLPQAQKNYVRFRLVVAHHNFHREVEEKLIPKNSELYALQLQNELFQSDQIIVEVKENVFFQRPSRLPEDYALENVDAQINQDHLGFVTSFELAAVENLQAYAMVKRDLRQAAFNALRCEVHDAAGGIGKRVFRKKRVLSILQPYVAKSALSAAEGVRVIDKEFLKEQEQVAQREDEELRDRERRGEMIPAYERPFRGRGARWQDIAANRDFPRSCLEDLCKRISEKAKPGFSAALVITGNNGEGKSALWMRTAVTCAGHGATVYQINDSLAFRNNGFNPLMRLIQMHPSECPILLLWDDIYEKDDWKELCQQLKLLPFPMDGASVFLLATAVENTVPKRNPTLDGFLEPFPLGGVTENEKEMIEAKFPQTKEMIKIGQLFLVAMLQAMETKGFEEIIQGWLDMINEKSQQGYSCLLFLCLPAHLGLNIPATLLNKLGFADCLDHPENHGLKGLLQQASAEVDVERWGQWIEGCHPVLAEAFLNQGVGAYEIANRYHQLIERVEGDSLPERRFFLHLLRRTLRVMESGTKLVRDVLQEHSDLVTRCRRNGTLRELAQYWPEIYQTLEQRDKAVECKEAALYMLPVDSGELVLLAEQLAQNGRLEKALEQLRTWIEGGHDRDTHAWGKYLELLSRKPKDRRPTQEEYAQRQAVLRQVEAWLFDCEPPSAGMWVQYLQLANECGTGSDRDKALREVASHLETWRGKYPVQGVAILEKYLHVVDEWRETGAKKALIDAVRSGVEESKLNEIITEWIQSPRISEAQSITHRWIEFPYILPKALDFTARWGSDQDRRAVLREILNQLVKPQWGMPKDPQYLWLKLASAIQHRGTEENVKQLLSQAKTFLAPSSVVRPLPVSWWIMFLKLLQLIVSKGPGSLQTPTQAAALALVFGEISENQWQNLKQALDVDWGNPGHLNQSETTLNELGSLLLRCPVEMITNEICAHFADICKKFPKASILRLHCANLAAKARRVQEAAALYERLSVHYPKWQDPYYHYALLCLSQSAYPHAEQLVRKGLGFDPRHTAMRMALAKALEGQGKAEEAMKEWRLITAFQAVEPYHASEGILEEQG